MKSLKIAFFGSDIFSYHCLQSLLCHNTNEHVIHLFHPPNAMDQLRNFKKLTIHQLPNKSDFKSFILPHTYNLGIVASFGYFIPRRIIESFDLAMINAHPSLLPRWRGAAPVQRAIMTNNQDDLGISIIDVHPTVIDAGDVWIQKKAELNSSELVTMCYTQWITHLGKMAGKMLWEIIRDGRNSADQFKNQKKPQIREISCADKINRSEGSISFAQLTASEIHNRFLAISHFIPIRCKSLHDPRPMQLVDCEIATEAPINQLTQPGSVHFDPCKSSLFISCRGGSWIRATKFRLWQKSNTFSAAQIINALDLKLHSVGFY